MPSIDSWWWCMFDRMLSRMLFRSRCNWLFCPGTSKSLLNLSVSILISLWSMRYTCVIERGNSMVGWADVAQAAWIRRAAKGMYGMREYCWCFCILLCIQSASHKASRHATVWRWVVRRKKFTKARFITICVVRKARFITRCVHSNLDEMRICELHSKVVLMAAYTASR